MADWSVVTAARSYAERGWAVLPLHSVKDGRCTCGKKDCSSPGKHPRTPHGVQDATTDQDQIGAWWVEWPDSNVGIATGLTSKLEVVDVDPRNGGMESWQHVDTPSTLTSQTGGGGYHLFYRQDKPQRGGKLAQGIDLKADGGYVVAAPSNHVNGVYQWVNPDALVVPAPIFNSKQNGSGPIVVPDQRDHIAAKLREGAEQGSRHYELVSLAGYFANVASAVPKSVALAILTMWGQHVVDPPISEADIRERVESVYRLYASADPTPVEYWTARTLLETEFPPLRWVVQDLLPEGLAFLGGAPKRGKSWLAIQLAVDIIAGRHTLGSTTLGKVVYLALEDGPRRFKDRLTAMEAPRSDDLIILHSFPRLDDGGTAKILELIEEHQPVLFVVDTLARILGRKVDANDAVVMTDLLGPVQALALRTHTLVLVLDHHRKPSENPGDMIDDLAGSVAKAGVADVVMGLYRKFSDPNAILKLTGRDIEEKELPLLWNGLKMRWSLEKGAALTVTERKIVDIVRELHEVEGSEIAKEVGLTERVIRDTLRNLRERGILHGNTVGGRVGHPKYLYSIPVAPNAT